MNDVKTFVQNYQAANNVKLSLPEQINYLKSATKQFKDGSAEQIEVLKMLKNAEDAYTKQVVSDAQKRQEAYQKYT